MTHANDFLDYERLPKLTEEGMLMRREHPTAPLFIYNYTPRCQYAGEWSPETLACRGLILDAAGNVLARPFGKFFNLSEHDSPKLPPLPLGEPFEAFEKLDGSLGIAYRAPDGKISIASRGAFASDQATWATTWWRENCSDVEIPEGQTWLFEIIYPSNRIVVNYGTRAELVFLAAIDNVTGRDLPFPENWTGAAAKRYGSVAIADLVSSVEDPQNFEGFVLYYPSTGQRVKVKLDEYVRLHRVLTQCSTKTIWELLMTGQGLDEVLARVPDEFYRWVHQQAAIIVEGYGEILEEATARAAELVVPGDRKATALRFVAEKYPPVMFKILDGKDPAELIWKMVRPEYEKPFIVQYETAA